MCDKSQYIKGILWDLDGVIADTHEWHLLSMQQAFEAHGFNAGREELHNLFGTNTEKIIASVLGEKATTQRILTIKQKHSELFCRNITGHVVIFPGVVETLALFHEMKLLQAIASSSTDEIIHTILGELGIIEYFDVLISGADLPAKPAPAVFLRAAKALSLSAEECLVIEDSPMGIRGAKAAGMKCLAVATSRSNDELIEADFVVDRLNKVNKVFLANMDL